MIRQVPVRSFNKNFSYLISKNGSKDLIIVDPSDSEQLIAEIEFESFIPKMIILTHSHKDHIDGVFGLIEKYGVPVFAHKNALSKLQKYGISAEEIPEKIIVQSLEINSIYTPGHSDDSICYYIQEENALISGDTLFVGSVGKVPDVLAMKNLYNSLSVIRKLNPKTLIFPGHDYGIRPVAQLYYEKKNNEFLKARNFFVFSKLFQV